MTIPASAEIELRPYANTLNEFYKYCLDFYNNRDGLYKLGASDNAIYWACIECAYYGIKNNSFDGDSLDREKVRAIIERDLKN